MVAELRGFTHRLIDGRVERDDPAQEFAPDRLGPLEFAAGNRQRVGETVGDFGRELSEYHCHPSPRAAEIGPGEDDASADDADADLAGPVHGKHESLPIKAADRPELVARDNCGGVPG